PQQFLFDQQTSERFVATSCVRCLLTGPLYSAVLTRALLLRGELVALAVLALQPPVEDRWRTAAHLSGDVATGAGRSWAASHHRLSLAAASQAVAPCNRSRYR